MSGIDCSEPGDVRTTGSDVGALSDLSAHDGETGLSFTDQIFSWQIIF